MTSEEVPRRVSFQEFMEQFQAEFEACEQLRRQSRQQYDRHTLSSVAGLRAMRDQLLSAIKDELIGDTDFLIRFTHAATSPPHDGSLQDLIGLFGFKKLGLLRGVIALGVIEVILSGAEESRDD